RPVAPGVRSAAGRSLDLRDSSGIDLAPSLASGGRGALGQPVHDAPARRLRFKESPGHAPYADQGRTRMLKMVPSVDRTTSALVGTWKAPVWTLNVKVPPNYRPGPSPPTRVRRAERRSNWSPVCNEPFVIGKTSFTGDHECRYSS